MLGLDNSGKTTILNQLKPPEAQSSNIQPTVGYTVEKSHQILKWMYTNIIVQIHCCRNAFQRLRHEWPIEIQESLGNSIQVGPIISFVWKLCDSYRNVHGIIFVVDSTDRLRFAVARDELWMLLDHKDLTYKKAMFLHKNKHIFNQNNTNWLFQTPLLILANKTDLKDAVPAAEIHLNLGLDLIRLEIVF